MQTTTLAGLTTVTKLDTHGVGVVTFVIIFSSSFLSYSDFSLYLIATGTLLGGCTLSTAIGSNFK